MAPGQDVTSGSLEVALRGRRVLITGGLGFVGSNLAIRLVELGAQVTIVDSMLPQYGGNLHNIEPIKDRLFVNFCDMRDPHTMPFIVKDKDLVFNLAGQVSHMDSMEDPFTDMEINSKAPLILLEACRRANPSTVIVYSSTRQFYGKPKYLPVDELHPIDPPDVNGITTLAGEQFHLLYHRIYGLKSVSLRLTNTYGPRQLIKNSRQGFIGWFFNRVMTQHPIEIFGDGKQIRDFTYVDDVVEALLLAATHPACYGDCFNLGGERSNLHDLAQMMVKKRGEGIVKLVPFPPERKKIDIGDFYGSHAKFTEATGWKPRVGLDEGVERTLAYYTAHKDKYL